MSALDWSATPELPLCDMGPLKVVQIASRPHFRGYAVEPASPSRPSELQSTLAGVRELALDLVNAAEALTESRKLLDQQARALEARWAANREARHG